MLLPRAAQRPWPYRLALAGYPLTSLPLAFILLWGTPRRLNPADDLTRFVEVRPPCQMSLIDLYPLECLHGLGELRMSRAWLLGADFSYPGWLYLAPHSAPARRFGGQVCPTRCLWAKMLPKFWRHFGASLERALGLVALRPPLCVGARISPA